MDPAVEQQAIARVHRIGQTRPVVAYRLLIESSVEVRQPLLIACTAWGLSVRGVGAAEKSRCVRTARM